VDGLGPEPTVEYEIHYEPRQIPGTYIDQLIESGLGIKRRTYAACAQAILADVQSRRQLAA
jgi:hypothetical protein